MGGQCVRIWLEAEEELVDDGLEVPEDEGELLKRMSSFDGIVVLSTLGLAGGSGIEACQ